MEAFEQAVAAIVADDRAALRLCLDAHPGLARQTVRAEAFIAAITHQFYAGDTLLHVAAAGFRAEMATDLIGTGADVSARNRRGAQALHYAADARRPSHGDQVATIVVLLKAGADANAKDKTGVAPLHRAVRRRGAAAVKALLDGGADANLKNGNGSTPLFLAGRTTGAGGSGSAEARAEQAEIVRLLRARGGR